MSKNLVRRDKHWRKMEAITRWLTMNWDGWIHALMVGQRMATANTMGINARPFRTNLKDSLKTWAWKSKFSSRDDEVASAGSYHTSRLFWCNQLNFAWRYWVFDEGIWFKKLRGLRGWCGLVIFLSSGPKWRIFLALMSCRRKHRRECLWYDYYCQFMRESLEFIKEVTAHG